MAATTSTTLPESSTYTQSNELTPRMTDLMSLSDYFESSSLASKAKTNVPLSLFLYIFRSLQSILSTLIFAPLTIFSDPIGVIAAIIIYPIIYFGLWLLTVVLWLTSLIGGGKLIEYLSKNYGDGYSPVNWANSRMFGPSSDAVIQEAKKILVGPTTYSDVPLEDAALGDEGETHTLRIFSVDLSIALLLFSSIVYERDDSKVTQASKLIQASRTQSEQEKSITLKKAQELLNQSEERIQIQASKWGTKYEIVSDLASLTGPFASVFYSLPNDEEPYIVLVFKGTGLSNFAEFLVDASIMRVSSQVFLGSGTAHQGFYTDLFPTSAGGADGYGTIIRHLHRIAETLRRGPNSPQVPLWITGHSLGSALASLFYFRLLYSPIDLGSSLLLRDSYNYGTPRIGSGSFAAQFSSLALTPLIRPNILWRVVDANDFVTKLPPGLADNEETREMIMKYSTLDYSHIGSLIQLSDKLGQGGVDMEKGDSLKEFYTKTKVVLARVVGEEEKDGGEETVLSRVLRFVPIPATFRNHFPAEYYKRLNRIQPTMVEDGKGNWKDINH